MASSELVSVCKKSAEGVPSCANAVIMDLEEVRKQMGKADLVESGEEGLPSKSLSECGWSLNEGSADVDPLISRRYDWPKRRRTSYLSAWKFVDLIAEMCEVAGHHPDVTFGWGYVSIVLTTHDVKGVSISDIVLAARIEEAYVKYKKAEDAAIAAKKAEDAAVAAKAEGDAANTPK
mmetsp:Transcript_67331/g.140274  ORF Transcript_67331/g.140274 Transcript_67331/m.140274 type:complete len:177 (-) Transcript_67331:289-819(-)|eukprot:CAMPEP_0181323042 /NCGR_PEP_ID=MMETSP1101-20121128/19564_1 /TAXON_ID=46948 /ORGANISM="Rhodomonas abbreviata, Strain Caron Lab Isolate" /LENGTH=176 /DNA_ID=CAMNT_0023431023 /DNA_START=45 /DNA_END=575 /DNA_ORIENTATION=+